MSQKENISVELPFAPILHWGTSSWFNWHQTSSVLILTTTTKKSKQKTAFQNPFCLPWPSFSSEYARRCSRLSKDTRHLPSGPLYPIKNCLSLSCHTTHQTFPLHCTRKSEYFSLFYSNLFRAVMSEQSTLEEELKILPDELPCGQQLRKIY